MQLLIDNLFERQISHTITVVEHFKQQKKYDDVIGVGLCSGALLLLGAQCPSEKNDKPLFTKLISSVLKDTLLIF